jgi:ubiquinone/menaquinone biosynthesis C-methylase UbiE
MTDDTLVPNHHRDYPGFSGLLGLLAAATMTTGRSGDARLAAELARLGPDDLVVDLGCGPGAAARHAARLGARVTGVDPATVMLRVARALTHGVDVRYVEGTAEALPLPDDSATVVWSIATVHHWRDLDAGLQEVRRVLRPGGRFVAIERHTQPNATGIASHGWTTEQAEEFARVLGRHGFDSTRVEPPRRSGRRWVIAAVATVH